jgi:hypothetical protein
MPAVTEILEMYDIPKSKLTLKLLVSLMRKHGGYGTDSDDDDYEFSDSDSEDEGSDE